jgi:hypothetical protein
LHATELYCILFGCYVRIEKTEIPEIFYCKYVGEEKFYRAEIAGLNQHERSSWRRKSKANTNDYLM